MSEPKNILDTFDNHSVYFVLAAFKYTDDAENQELYLDATKTMGDSMGKGIVVVNDVRPTPLQIINYKYRYSWNSISTSTTLSTGEITFSDRNPGSFFNFVREELVTKLETSLENITFSLRIFWNSQVADFTTDHYIEKSDHLFFSIADLSHYTKVSHHFYTATILPLHNCKCQLPTYNKIYNMTITHKSGNLHDEIPQAEPASGSIMPRGAEDGLKNGPRNTRIQKSKPMETLKDLQEALEVELNQRCFIHKSQLQEWQAVIRDNFKDKLEKNPKQTKELPINYHVTFGDGYGEYKVDNRTLPFEQPEQDQTIPGIRSLAVKSGETISSVVDKIMNLSKQVGIDAQNGDSYKLAMSWRRLNSNIIKYNINLRKFTIPVNESGEGKNTGPGKSAVQPLTFFYRTTKNGDVTAFTGTISRNDILTITENSPSDDDGKLAYGPERESITAERDRENEFFKSGFSGHRAFIAEDRVLAVEYPRELASKFASKFAPQSVQDATMKLTIRGNPKLYSDLLRKPTDVAEQKEGSPNYYKFPEYYPLYCKFLIEYPSPDLPENDPNFSESEEIKGPFYHQNYMHILSIDTEIDNGKFVQHLELVRRDNII